MLICHMHIIQGNTVVIKTIKILHYVRTMKCSSLWTKSHVNYVLTLSFIIYVATWFLHIPLDSAQAYQEPRDWGNLYYYHMCLQSTEGSSIKFWSSIDTISPGAFAKEVHHFWTLWKMYKSNCRGKAYKHQNVLPSINGCNDNWLFSLL